MSQGWFHRMHEFDGSITFRRLTWHPVLRKMPRVFAPEQTPAGGAVPGLEIQE
jgi:hypothetical protein